MPPKPTTGLLRAAHAASGYVLVAADSSTVDGSSALPLIHVDDARDGRRRLGRH